MEIQNQKIVTHLSFKNQAVEAARFYCSIFPESKITSITHLPNTPGGDCEVVIFQLFGQPFIALGTDFAPSFNESLSLLIQCETQEEIDDYYEKLSADPEAEQCGWIKDKYGFSWQITSTQMATVFDNGSAEDVRKFTEAVWKMKRTDLDKLNAAILNASEKHKEKKPTKKPLTSC